VNYLKIFIAIIFFAITLKSLGQDATKIDSLKFALKEKVNTSSEKLTILFQLSEFLEDDENYSEAIKYKIRELQIHKENSSDSLAARAQEKIGVMFYKTGNYDVSAEYFLESLNYFEKTNDKLLVAQITGNLANVYTRIDNYVRAIEYLNRARKIYENTPGLSNNSLAGLYVNLGLAHAGNKTYDTAMEYYEKSLGLIQGHDNYLYEASIYNNMGEVYFELQQFELAYENYEKALDFFTKINNKRGMGSTLSNLAKVQIEKREYSRAVELANKALIYFEEIDAKFFIVDVQNQLGEAYKKSNNYEKSLMHFEQYIKLLEELKGTEITERIASIELQNMIRKEEQKLQLIKQQAELREKESKLSEIKLYITIIGIFVLLVVTILIIFNQRGRLQRNTLKQEILQREQEKLQNDLQFKKREIENFAIHIQEKNELLKSLNTEIKNVARNNDLDYKDLNEITNLVNHSLYIDNNRKELELKINQAQQDFLFRLKSKFDSLTKTDLRLCSFLILEFSTKEISAFMNIEPSSVKMSRNRLRKKLNLPPSANIKAFLNTVKRSN
jgi:tetratricopeptide (TPR) repeat protein